MIHRSAISSSAVERIAEIRIRAAIEAGEMDGLPGLGKPIPGIDEAYDPLWWVKSWMTRNGLAEAMGREEMPHIRPAAWTRRAPPP
jgi:hypothetical protein